MRDSIRQLRQYNRWIGNMTLDKVKAEPDYAYKLLIGSSDCMAKIAIRLERVKSIFNEQ